MKWVSKKSIEVANSADNRFHADHDDPYDFPSETNVSRVKRGRGRPKGSKNCVTLVQIDESLSDLPDDLISIIVSPVQLKVADNENVPSCDDAPSHENVPSHDDLPSHDDDVLSREDNVVIIDQENMVSLMYVDVEEVCMG